MTETKRPLKVFLCHAHSDKETVKALYARLTKDGVDAWLDKEKLLPGQDWELETRRAVHESDAVIVCLSRQFNQAGFQQKQVKWALDTAMELPEGEIFIIPLLLEECNIPDSLRRWLSIDLSESDSYDRLMESLHFKEYKSVLSVKPRALESAVIPTTEKIRLAIPPSPYAPEKFINREREIDAVMSVLERSRRGEQNRAIVFTGGRGTGKLWLSLHLHRTLFKRLNGITSWLFSLSPASEGYMPWGKMPQPNEYFIQHYTKFEINEFLFEIVRSLSIELPSKPTVSEIVHCVYQHMQLHPSQQYVLILDSAFDGDWHLLEQLETHFLEALIRINNFSVIITGRGRYYPWKIMQLRTASVVDLQRFTPQQVDEQLVRYAMSSTFSSQKIFDVSGGSPLLTEPIASATNLANAIEISALLLFLDIPEHNRVYIRRYFEALCSLEGFGETEVALMMETYDPMAEREDGRLICRKMSETHLISWRDGRYVMDVTVQYILRQYLRLFKPDDWIRLNCVTYRYFQSRRDDPTFDRFRSYFDDQMNIHSEALLEAGVNPIDCINS